MGRLPFALRTAVAVLLLGLVAGSSPDAAAADHAWALEPAAEEAPAEGSSAGWGKIVGACLGVLFGGALAMWQIRRMKDR